LGEHHVVIEFQREPFIELDTFIVKGDTLRRAVVGADDGRVPAAGAAAQITLVEERDVGDAVVLAEVVSNGQTVNAGADDYDVVGGFQIMGAPHALNRHPIASAIRGRPRGGAWKQAPPRERPLNVFKRTMYDHGRSSTRPPFS